MITRIDHVSEGLSRLVNQYQNSQRLRQLLTALLTYSVEVEDLLIKVSTQSDIDIAEGVNLDVLGQILGRSRIIPESLPVEFFGFLGQPSILSYGEEGKPGIGGRFRDESEAGYGNTVLADPEYRLFLKAQIIRNHGKGTREDVILGLSTIFPNSPVAVTDNGVMTMQIGIGRWLQKWEQVTIKDLDLISRPAGVLLSQTVHWDNENYFGFEDQPGAFGFLEENGSPSTTGGIFAEEF